MAYFDVSGKVPNDPILASDWNKLAGNIEAVADGDPTAPAISPAALRWRCEVVYYHKASGANITGGTNGAWTWTCPAGVDVVKIEAVGGGGGGGGGYAQGGNDGSNGSDGGDTSFDGTVVAGGGSGGVGGSDESGAGAGGAGGTQTGVDLSIDGFNGDNGSGVASPTTRGGEPGVCYLNQIEQMGGLQGGKDGSSFAVGGKASSPSSGAGGGGGGYGDQPWPGGSGGGGGIGQKAFNVTPSTGYSIQIGAGGNGGGAWSSIPGGTGGTGLGGTDGGDADTFNKGGGGGGGSAGRLHIWYAEPDT